MAEIRPALCIQGTMTVETVLSRVSDPTSPWNNRPKQWRVRIVVTQQRHSYGNTRYGAGDIKVGDWVASSSGGIAVVIDEIIQVVSSTEIVLSVSDEDLYNIHADPSASGTGIGPAGRCVIFEVSSENGMPVVAPFPNNYLPYTAQADILSRFIYQGKLAGGGGGSDYLQEPEDGSFADGTFPDWEVGVTTVSTAIDDLSEMLGLLIPAPAPRLSTKVLSITGAVNVRGSDILLASGAANNDATLASPPAAGTKIYRTTTTPITTDLVTTFHDGSGGTLTAKINGTVQGSKVLTTASDTGTTGALIIAKDAAYPADKPGFWTALDARVGGAILLGVNRIELTHTSTGSATPAVFALDGLTALPVASGFTVASSVPGTLAYSSGVPHYTAGARLAVGAEVNNLSGQTYLSSNIIQFGTTPDIGSLNISPGAAGIPAILEVNHAPITVTGQSVDLTGTQHTTSTIRVRGVNPQGDGTWVNSTTLLNYMNGLGTGMVESGKAMSGVTLKRIAMATGSRPADEVLTFNGATFNSGSDSALGDATAAHEAIIRGGVLRCDQTNYSTGYLPAGPNYSSRPATQYATFIIKKVSNSMVVAITGSDPAEMWVKLPGLARAMPTAINGWWDAKKAANFAPGRWPGDSGADDGCLSSKSGTTYNLTFGSASSAGSNDNLVMIRVALTAGQSISNIVVTI